MSYLRAPTAVRAGRALKQTVDADPKSPAGNLAFDLDVDVATTSGLGVVQIGSGLSITASGVLSATGSGGNSCATTYINRDYSIEPNDYYIGVVKGQEDIISIILPMPQPECRTIIIKDQRGPGRYKVYLLPQTGSTLEGETNPLKLEQPYESITLLGQGSAWWVIARVQQ
jgi:hypothetical protein